MKRLLIVANWKANKTETEAISWLESFYEEQEKIKENQDREIIVCPPFTLLLQIKKYIDANNLALSLGSQDISRFKQGAYTGEIPAEILSSIVKYTIIGHSERRKNFGDTDEILNEKVMMAEGANIIPIFCVQNENTPVPGNVKIVAYEPIESIGTGNPDTPENADKTASVLKSKNPNVEAVLYGGSVKEDNVKGFIDSPNINGVLVGGASLDAKSFSSLICAC
jgi:triosephosphate isomerase